MSMLYVSNAVANRLSGKTIFSYTAQQLAAETTGRGHVELTVFNTNNHSKIFSPK